MSTKKIGILLCMLLVVLSVPLVALAATVTTESTTLSYTNLSAGSSITSSAIAFTQDNMKVTSTWSSVVTDMDNGYYAQLTVSKKGTLVYKTLSTSTFSNIKTSTTGVVTANGAGAGTYKFKMYNYSVWTSGELSINFSSATY